MSLKVLLLRGTTEQNNLYVGNNGELTIDVSTRSLRIHDGSTSGGHPVLGNQQVQDLVDALAERIDKNDVGLSQVDNTADIDKPVSTPQQGALDDLEFALKNNIDTKVDLSDYAEFKAVVEALDTGVSSVTGEGPITVMGDVNPIIDIKEVTPTEKGAMSASDKEKLDTVETGAQVNTVTGVAGRTGDVVLDKDDVNLENVENYGIATTAESETGQTNEKYATPLSVRGFVEGMGFEQDTETGEWSLDQGDM